MQTTTKIAATGGVALAACAGCCAVSIVPAVVAGLVLGKVVGVLGVTALLTRVTALRLPAGIGLRDLLPVVALFGAGLATMVAPLTSAALSSVPASHAGLASGVNNAVARTAALLSIAAIPAAAGLSGDVFARPDAFRHGFDIAMGLSAALFALGALVAALGVGRSPRASA